MAGWLAGPRTEKHAVNSLLLNRRVTYVFSDRGELCLADAPGERRPFLKIYPGAVVAEDLLDK